MCHNKLPICDRFLRIRIVTRVFPWSYEVEGATIKHVIDNKLTYSFSSLCVAVLSVFPVQAELDQSFAVTRSIGSVSAAAISYDDAQTFTSSVSGRLDAVSLQISESFQGASGEVWIDIWGVGPDGKPLADYDIFSSSFPGTPLASSQIPKETIPDDLETVNNVIYSTADFSLSGLYVVAGQQYAIVPRRTDLTNPGTFPWFVWSRSQAPTGEDNYTGGQSFDYDLFSKQWSEVERTDYGFQTFVTVPEPGTGLLVLAGIGAMLSRRRCSAG